MVPPERQADAAEVSLSVAAVARRLGVAPATLRTWDRRYGLGPSEHEPGAHRRYTALDVARLVVMRRLTLEGVAPVQAAATASAVHDDELAHAAPGGDAGTSTAVPSAPDTAGRPREPRESAETLDGVLRAAADGQVGTCTRLVLAALDDIGPVAVLEDLLRPAVEGLRRRWEVAAAGVDASLVLAAGAMGALRAWPAPPERTAASVLVATPEHQPWCLAPHVLAAAAAADGVRARVVPNGLPREAVAAAVRRTGPVVLLLHAEQFEPDASAQLAVLPRLRAPGRTVLSGPGWAHVHVPDGRVVLRAEGIREAADLVTSLTAA